MTTRQSPFVAKSVEAPPQTRRIIEQIQPYMPRGTTVIGGYLNSRQQIFKLNYHWELLVHNIDLCLGHQMSDSNRAGLLRVRNRLMRHAPAKRGYIQACTVDSIVDHSSSFAVLERWKTVKQAKRDFSSMVQAGALEKHVPAISAHMKLIRSPILPPGHSQHGTGKALDIKGDKARIERVCWALGATLVFVEDFHVHAEFLKGVLSEPDFSRHRHSPHVHHIHHRH